MSCFSPSAANSSSKSALAVSRATSYSAEILSTSWSSVLPSACFQKRLAISFNSWTWLSSGEIITIAPSTSRHASFGFLVISPLMLQSPSRIQRSGENKAGGTVFLQLAPAKCATEFHARFFRWRKIERKATERVEPASQKEFPSVLRWPASRDRNLRRELNDFGPPPGILPRKACRGPANNRWNSGLAKFRR